MNFHPVRLLPFCAYCNRSICLAFVTPARVLFNFFGIRRQNKVFLLLVWHTNKCVPASQRPSYCNLFSFALDLGISWAPNSGHFLTIICQVGVGREVFCVVNATFLRWSSFVDLSTRSTLDCVRYSILFFLTPRLISINHWSFWRCSPTDACDKSRKPGTLAHPSAGMWVPICHVIISFYFRSLFRSIVPIGNVSLSWERQR